MRDNGLTAASYTSLGPLEPRIADNVLTSLAEAGIAAYVGTPDSTPAKPDPAEPDPAEPDTTDAGTEAETEAGAAGPVDAEASTADEPAGPTTTGPSTATTGPTPAETSTTGAGATGASTGEANANDAGADDANAADTDADADAADADAASTTAAQAAAAQAAADADGQADADAADVAAGGTAAAGGGVGDELYVDSEAAERARQVVRRRTEDAEWESLIEQFNAPDEPAVGGIPRWPSIEDVEADQPDPSGGSSTSRTPVTDAAGSVVDEMAAEYPGREAKAEAEEEAEEERREREEARYIPPEPARGPRLDWISRAAWTGVLGGPLLLILAAVLDLGSSSRVTVIALIGFAGGFLTLVARMKDRDTDGTGGPDDGAVV